MMDILLDFVVVVVVAVVVQVVNFALYVVVGVGVLLVQIRFQQVSVDGSFSSRSSSSRFFLVEIVDLLPLLFVV